MGGFSGAFSGSGGYDMSSSSGVGGGDQWASQGADFGNTVVNAGGGGSGFSVSTPVMVIGLIVAAFVVVKVVK